MPPPMQLATQDNLPLRDVSRQIRDGVSLVILGHGENGDLGNGTLASLDAAGPLVDGGQVGIEVARVAAATRHLLAGGRDLAQGLGIVGHVRQDYQDVHVLLIGEVFGGGQGHPGRGDAFDGRVVGQVYEDHGPFNGARPMEVADKIIRFFESDAHGREDHGEPSLGPEHLGLPRDLGRQPRMRQAGGGEDGQLLSPYQGVEPVDGRDTGLDEFGRIVPRVWIDGITD